MKKTLSIILAIALVALSLPLNVFTFNVNASSSGSYTYEVIGDKATITKVDSQISGTVSIPEKLGGYDVVAIGDKAFYECNNITKVVVPSSVKVIEDGAFAFCENLVSVTLPSQIEIIEKGTFSDCKKLSEINIPNSVVTIEEMAFYNCNELENIDLQSVANIGDYAFGYSGLQSVVISSSVVTVGEGAFAFCQNLANVRIENGIKNIAKLMFYNCQQLTRIILSDSVELICSSAFDGCTNLESAQLSVNVKKIENYAFDNCNKFADVWYSGNETDKDEIIIGLYNDAVLTANWHCDMCKENQHNYEQNCFEGCTKCGWIPSEHTYSNACDTYCNYCSQTREVSTNHTYNECFDGYVEELYRSWEINITETGVYSVLPNSNFAGNNSIHNIALLDKNGKKIVYNEANGGFPLVSGQKYTIKFKYNCGSQISGTVTWKKEKITSKIFPDTSSSGWYIDAVTYAVGAGIMKGYASNGKFGTEDNLQRQDFIVMLANYEGINEADYNYKSTLRDVSSSGYYKAAVNWAIAAGITTGYDNGKFGVGDNITREQIVTFLYRYAQYKGINVEVDPAEKAQIAAQYKDFKKVSSFSQKEVVWAIANGVINGMDATTINPQGNASRAQIAQIMYNIFLNDIF